MTRTDLAGMVLVALGATAFAGSALAGGHSGGGYGGGGHGGHHAGGGIAPRAAHATTPTPQRSRTAYNRPVLMAPLQGNDGSSGGYDGGDRRYGAAQPTSSGTDYSRTDYAPGMPHLGGGFEHHAPGTLEHRYGGGYDQAPAPEGRRAFARPRQMASDEPPRRVFTGSQRGAGYGTNAGYGYATYGEGGPYPPTTTYVPGPYDAGYGYPYAYPYDGLGLCAACFVGAFGSRPYGY